MHVTGLDRVWFAVLRGRRLDLHTVERDQDDIDFMVERADDFWTNHVLTQVPPEVDGSEATSRTLDEVYPGGAQDTVEVPSIVVAEWRHAKTVAKAADEALREAENAVKAALGDHEAGSCDGALVATWKPQERKGALDEQALATVVDDLEQFRKPPSTFRVLRMSTRKEKP
jgi:predicted phage-related endonuclease